ELLSNNRHLDRQLVVGHLLKQTSGTFAAFLRALPSNLIPLLAVAPEADYLLALQNIGLVASPLASLLAERNVIKSLDTAQGESNEHRRFVEEVEGALRASLSNALVDPLAPSQFNMQTAEWAHSKLDSGIGEALKELFNEIDRWKSSQASFSLSQARDRIQILAERLKIIDRKLPFMGALSDVF